MAYSIPGYRLHQPSAHLYQPSAPDYEEEVNTGAFPQAYQARPTQQTQKQPEKDFEQEDCSICCERLSHRANGDNRNVKVLNQTACNHFFHDFCLQTWLKVQATCPNCRGAASANSVKKIELSSKEAAPIPTARATPISQPKSPAQPFITKEHVNAALDAAKSGFDMFKDGFFFLANKGGQGINNFFETTFKAQQQRTLNSKNEKSQQAFGDIKVRIKNLQKRLLAQQEGLEILIATVASLPASKASQGNTILKKAMENFTEFEKIISISSDSLAELVRTQQSQLNR